MRPSHHVRKRGLDAVLGGGVDARGGVVQDQDARLGQQGTGDRHALALPAAERQAALADERVETIGQLLEQLRQPGALRRGGDVLLARVGARVGDVVAERRREQEGVVRDHGHLAAQRRGIHLAHVHAVHEHGALVHVVQARDEHHERRLARAGRPDDRDGAARLHVDVDTAEHRLVTVIAEAHAAQLHAPAARRQRLCVRRGREARLAVEQLEHARPARHGALGHPERHAEPAHRPREHQDVAVERDELADGDAAVDRLPAANEQQRGEPELGEEADEGRVERAQARGDHRLVEHARDRPAEAAQLALLLRERLHHAHAADVLLGLGGQLGDALLHLLRGRPVALSVAEGDPDDERGGGEGHRREAGIERDHHDRRDQDRDGGLDQEDQAVAEEEAHRLQVHGGPRHQLAGLLPVEEGQLERLEVLVHPVAQVVLDPQRDPAGNDPARDAERQPQHPRARHGERQRPEVSAAGPDLVDRAADQVWHQHAHAHRGGREHEREDHAATVWAEKAEQAPEGLHRQSTLEASPCFAGAPRGE